MMADFDGDDQFDAYGQWLEIPGDRRPPTYYDLLGVKASIADVDQIREAFRERYKHVRRFQVGRRGDLAHRVLNELSMAVACLSDPDRRRQYDDALFAEMLRDTAAGGNNVFTAEHLPGPPSDGTVSDAVESSDDQDATDAALGTGDSLHDLLQHLESGSAPSSAGRENAKRENAAKRPGKPGSRFVFPEQPSANVAPPPIPPPRKTPQSAARAAPPPINPPRKSTSGGARLPDQSPKAAVASPPRQAKNADAEFGESHSLVHLLAPWIGMGLLISVAVVVGNTCGELFGNPYGPLESIARSGMLKNLIQLTFWPGTIVGSIWVAWMLVDAVQESIERRDGWQARGRFVIKYTSVQLAEFDRTFFALAVFLCMAAFAIAAHIASTPW